MNKIVIEAKNFSAAKRTLKKYCPNVSPSLVFFGRREHGLRRFWFLVGEDFEFYSDEDIQTFNFDETSEEG